MSKHAGGGRRGESEEVEPLELPADIWTVLPGWGIVADLMPPEVLAERRVHVVRRRVSAALAGVLALCLLGTAYGWFQKDQASGNLADVQAHTAQLVAQQGNFGDVVRLQGEAAKVDQQLPVLLADDVDHAALLEQLRAKLPATMAINLIDITVETNKPAAAGESGTGAATLDASGQKHIGSVTVGGTGAALSDLAAYVDALRSVPGVVEPYPLSNKTVTPGTQFSLQLTLTDVLLTKKYAATKNRGN